MSKKNNRSIKQRAMEAARRAEDERLAKNKKEAERRQAVKDASDRAYEKQRARLNKKPKVAPVSAASSLKKQLKKMSLDGSKAKKNKIHMESSSSDSEGEEIQIKEPKVPKVKRGLSRADHCKIKKDIRRMRSSGVSGCKKKARKMREAYEDKKKEQQSFQFAGFSEPMER